jgi:hypothetical protein
MGMVYSRGKRNRKQRAARNERINATSRSGEVVVRKVGEPKVEPPPPTDRQIARQRKTSRKTWES